MHNIKREKNIGLDIVLKNYIQQELYLHIIKTDRKIRIVNQEIIVKHLHQKVIINLIQNLYNWQENIIVQAG